MNEQMILGNNIWLNVGFSKIYWISSRRYCDKYIHWYKLLPIFTIAKEQMGHAVSIQCIRSDMFFWS